MVYKGLLQEVESDHCSLNPFFLSFVMEFSKNKLNADDRLVFVKNMLQDQLGLVVWIPPHWERYCC